MPQRLGVYLICYVLRFVVETQQQSKRLTFEITAVYSEIRLIFRIQNSSSALRARKVSSFRLGFEAFGKKLLGTCCV